MGSKIHRNLPKIVLTWMIQYNAWLAGSGVDWYLIGGEPDLRPRDLDVIIPPQHFQSACQLVNPNDPVKFNSFGGCNVYLTEDKISVDFWPAHIEDFATVTNKLATRVLRLNPYTLIRINKEETNE